MNSAPVDLQKLQRVSAVAGIIAAIICAISAALNQVQFFRAYLLAFLFWLGVPLGCLALLMLHHLVGGVWAFSIRNVMESAASTLPLSLILFLPLLFGITILYPWTDPDFAREIPGDKAGYLNFGFFLVRSAVYFAVWILITALMRRWAGDHGENSDAAPTKRLRVASAWGLVFYVLTVSFAAVDWVMSLEPEWYSSIYGMLFSIGQILTALTTIILVISFFGETNHLISAKPLHDLGNLLLAFVLLWTYLAFMQFLIIWTGNVQEGAIWYVHRSKGAWPWVALLLLALHFFVPFLLLLSRGTKRHLKILASVAACIWLMRWVDYLWHLGPLPGREEVPIHWIYFSTMIALGGIWFAFFFRQLRKRRSVVLVANETERVA